MARIFQPSRPIVERPREAWSTIAVELLGAQSRFIQGKHWRHRVIEMGDGPPLLLYHGVGGHAETYARTLPQLAKHFHVYAVDALFHGYSSKEGFDWAEHYNLMVEGVVDLVDALGYDKVLFEGESQGSVMGLMIGLRYPELVERMVLNTGFYYVVNRDFEGDDTEGISEELARLSHAAIVDPTYDNVAARMRWLVYDPDSMTPEMIALRQRLYEDPAINAAMRQVCGVDGGWNNGAINVPYTEADLARWNVPALVLWGEHNAGNGVRYGEYCAELIDADFYVVERAGHWPQWERPDEYSQVMIDFFTR